jgi:N,N-dimethylformamidase
MTFFMDHPEFGRSIYDNHTDGTPIQISSWLRPSFSITINSFLHLVTADSEAVDWLEHINIPYDVITEDMIHREGVDLIQDYRVLITGQHPEYNSGRTQDILSEYMTHGGRIMYLGANGFTTTIAWHPELPIIEIRKSNLDWTSPIWLRGESTVMEFDGTSCQSTETWPARELGVSFQGDIYAIYYMTGNTYYKVLPDANSSRAQFIFNGVKNRNVIGDFGTHFGGAAGDEVDAFAPHLGAPAHALHLARSEGVPAPFWASPETATLYEKIHSNPESRTYASMVFFETQSGGAVFSVGSLAWTGALSHNGFDNDVCRITTNVLQRFLDPMRFEFPIKNT